MTPTTAASPSSPRIRDSAAAATFVILSPRHPDVEAWAGGDGVREQLDELRSGGWERSARDASAVPVIDTGASITGPAGAELPVLVSPLVDARYGPTAALGIPVVGRGRRGARRARGQGRRGAVGRGRRWAERPDRRYRAVGLLDLPAALLGDADPGRPLRGLRRRPGPGRGPAGGAAARHRADRARATRSPSGRTSSTSPARAAVGPPSARPTPSTATSTPSGSGSRRRCRPRTGPRRCSPTPTCSAGCPRSGSSPATTAAASSSTSGS